MKYQLRPYQLEAANAAVAAFNKGRSNGILVLPTGCHAKGTKVLMYDGTMKCVENVSAGDLLMGVDSTPRRVSELHRGEDEMFEITPKIGTPFVVNKGHILSLYKTKEGDRPYELPRVDEISVGDYLNATKTYKHIHKLHKPAQIDFGHIDGYVGEPYLLGLYLGDGNSTNGNFNITTMRQEVADYLSTFCNKAGYNIRIKQKENNKAKTYFITDNGKKNKPNPILDWLRDLGLFGLTGGDKFIPHSYKTASVRDRYQLLAGLLDTDAWYDDNKCVYEYCTKSLVMAKDIRFLCRSLGFMCNIGKTKVVNDTNYYRMQISGDLEKIPTKVAIRKARPRRMKKSVLVTGFDIKAVGRGEYYGFTLDGDHLYMDEQFFIHHNSGKSLVIGEIASRLDSPLLVFQPSVEILKQNYEKICSYDILDVGLYSASVNRKNIRRITLATIGSVVNHADDFRLFKYLLIDECHGVSSQEGTMYKDFIESRSDRVVVGLTASPYRLQRDSYGGSILKFLTRTRPRVFGKVLYVCQTGDLLRGGYISPVQYFDVTDKISFDLRRVKVNSTGADYDEDSLKEEYRRSDFMTDLTNWTMRVLRPNDGSRRKGVLVFTRFVRESAYLVDRLRERGVSAVVVSGETKKSERNRIVEDFKAGRIQVLANANVFSMGFDYPALDTVIIAHPTRSLARWYQQIGRVVRLSPGKRAWVLDLCGNYRRFGGFEDLKIECPLGSSRWVVTSNGRQLTGVTLQ